MPGSVFTFYSYKGGVGRSFTLANIAVLLARWGHRVLCLDWDLEAPRLRASFRPRLPAPGRRARRGGGGPAGVDAFRPGRVELEARVHRLARVRVLDFIAAAREDP